MCIRDSQDTKKVNTIEEFKNREYRYSMSEKAVIIERMTITLENIHFESGNLSTNYISRMIDNLEEISFLFSRKESTDSIYECWRIIQEDFKQINQNYQDYLKAVSYTHLLVMDGIEGKVPYFVGVEGAKFKSPIRPGDQVIYEVEVEKIKRNFVKAHGVAKVDGTVACEATFTFCITDK